MDNANQNRVHRVSWLICGDESYGMRSAYLSLHKGLQAYGWPVSVVAMVDGPMASALRERGVAVQCMGAIGAQWPFLLDGGTVGRLRKFMLRHRLARRGGAELAALLLAQGCDAIYVRWPGLLPVASRAAARLGVPCFWHSPSAFNETGLRLSAKLYQWQCYRYNVASMANSAHTASTLGQWPVRPKVVHLGADSTVFDPHRVRPVSRRDLGIPGDAVVIGVFASISWKKGQGRVFQAILSLGNEAGNVHLLLVGRTWVPEALTSMQRAAAQARAAGRLHVAGDVSDPERYWLAVDVGASCYIGAEGFGLSVVEGMMMGRPQLVHARGGPAETVIDGITGWHAPDASVESFACGLRRVIADRERWMSMGQAARDRALTCFSCEAFAQRFMGIVRETVARRAGSPAAVRDGLEAT